MADICVEFHGYADCEACCGACSSCTNMQPISTSYPHDEDNCKSRAAAICSASVTPGQGTGGLGQEYNPYYEYAGMDNQEDNTFDIDKTPKGMDDSRYGMKRTNIKKTLDLRESELVKLISRVINEHTEYGGPNHDPNTHYHGYNCNPQGCAETASLTDPNPGQYSTLSDCQAACTGTCNKDCNQLVPSSFAGLIANKPCNWLNNRQNAFTTRMGTLEQLSCQWKRVWCKYKQVQARKLQLGC
jgi:hypothetical protein